MKLSLSGFLFEDHYTSQSVDFATFCSIAQSYGYRGVELRRTQVNPDTPVCERKQLLQIAEDHGLEVTCLTARRMPQSGQERDIFFQRYLDLCRDMECLLMKIASDPAWCHEAATKAEAYGVTLASNNHVGGQLETVRGTRDFFNSVEHPNYGLLYDCLHLSVSGEDYLGCIPEFAGLTKNILIHSVRPARRSEEPSMRAHGKSWVTALPDEEGVQDWKSVVAEFQRQGYDGLITVIESGWPTDLRETIACQCASTERELWQADGD